MKRLLFATSFLIFIIFSIRYSDAAVMEDYCAVPPYVVQNVAPNVMIVLDNSGSMFNFAYFDGFDTTATGDDNLCSNSGSPCTGFTTPGTYPTYKYYGYFNPDYWYTYSSNRFQPSAPKTGSGLAGERSKATAEWDGNFLNWLTMRRIDVVRKVMTGGRTTSGEGSGYNRLIGEKADCDSRGTYKQIGNVQNYTDSTYSGTRCLRVITAGGSCNGSGSGTSSFDVASGSSCSSFGSDYNVAARVPVPVEGVLQNVVGARARLGLSFYNQNAPTPHGGHIRVTVAGGSLSSTVNEINLTRPDSNTPLAETLWTNVGYFAQQASMESGPGPRYNSGDFQINNNVDPLNYGTGGQAIYRSCAKSYILYITDGEPCSDGNIPSTIADYANTRSKYNCSGTSCPAVDSFPASTFPSCSAGNNVAGVEDVALWMHTKDLRNSPTLGVNNINGTQNLTLYAVFAFGKGSTLLRYAAINGGFEDSNGDNIPDVQSEWDNNNDGEPDTFFEAEEGYVLEQAIEEAFLSILKRASSGTAASVLASGEGQGANLVQAVFYPRRRIGNYSLAWTGALQNLWFHVDPFFANSTIREDTTEDNILNLSNDDILQFYYDSELQKTMAKFFDDSDGDGAQDSVSPYTTKEFDNLSNPLKYLWEAGRLLWSRDISSDPRTMYMPCISGTTCIGSTNMTNFLSADRATLRPYIQATDDTDADYIIRYMHGEGLTTLKNDDGDTVIAGIDRDGDGADDFRPRYASIGDDTKVWKLGDILNSTPRIASWAQLNDYDIQKKYKDISYKAFINDTTKYKNRGMVFTGGNDGMLHAFYLGKLELTGSWKDAETKKAKLSDPSSIGIGREMWTFIPKNALPYLKYITNPEYCHIYNVDLSPYIFDASIDSPSVGDASNDNRPNDGSTWRTILIGGMRTGGACKPVNVNCSTDTPNSVCAPIDIGGQSIGYSSYFALDITDNLANPSNPPVLLWEFSNSQLGYATSSPAIVRVGDKLKNGKWFAVLGSGPTGPISTADQQFMGRSDQNLRFFILDLKTGNLLRTITTDIQYAFAGSMINSTNDSDVSSSSDWDYQDDAVYIGYVKRKGPSPYTWNDGGVGRLITKEDANPSNWVWSKVLDGIGPVTSSIAKLQKDRGCYTQTPSGAVEGCVWLYFATGRYYYAQESGIDDPGSSIDLRKLYGIKEPCLKTITGGIEVDPDCTSAASGFDDVTSIADVPLDSESFSANFKGWYINLDAPSTGYGGERIITDPLASTNGIVFFTSMKPYTDVCSIGGKSFIWALDYNTGGSAAAALKGMAILQVSTASIEQVDLSTAFTEKDGRRTSSMEGLPPTSQGLSILSPPPPIKRTVHIRER
ncbi:MAG: hypothetical protein C4538_01375 [Nitrospiraceae bacterium]|nr:MAG: hypothetical protein C4538_01375 [Nitrospiraceae bacterium]